MIIESAHYGRTVPYSEKCDCPDHCASHNTNCHYSDSLQVRTWMGFLLPPRRPRASDGILSQWCPSIHRPSIRHSHFQLSLVTIVSGAFILYAWGWSPVSCILDFGSRCRASWIQNDRHLKYKKKHILSSFLKFLAYIYMNCIPLDFKS